MTRTRNPVTLLLLGLLALQAASKTIDLTFPLHKSDELCVNINNVLSGDQMLNDLSVTQVGDFKHLIPNAIERQDVADFVPSDVVPSSISDLTTFGKKLAALGRTTGGQNVGVIFKYDPKTNKASSTVYEIAPGDAQCNRLSMDQSTLSTVCYSQTEHQAFFCSVNYEKQYSYDCSAALKFNLPFDTPVLDGKIEMDSFGGRGKNRLFAFFYKSGAGAYNKVKHMFYLRDNLIQKFIALEETVTILSISITSYDFERKITNLLIFVEEENKTRSLRYYMLEDFIITKQNGHEYERFDVKPSEIYFRDYSLFIVENGDQAGLSVRRVNLKERKFPKLNLKDQTSVLRIGGSRHLFLFETEGADKGTTNWFILDTFCDRFYKFDQVMEGIRGHKWTIMQIGYDSFIVVFKEAGAVFYKVHSFQSVCATFPNEGFKKGELKFSVNGQPLLNAQIENYEFEHVLDKEIVSKQVALSMDVDAERQFHLSIHGNDLDFSENSNVYFFHPVHLATVDEGTERACIPLRILVKNRNLVYLCNDNRILLFSSYSLDFATRSFEFKFKSTFSFQDFNLKDITDVKLYYGQYLALINKEARFTYIDLLSDADTLPVIHSDELKQYDRCVFSKHHILCKKDAYFVVLEVAKNNEQLVFSVLNAHLLENTLLESVIVSQYHQNTLYYIRKSFNKDDTYHLIQEIDRVDRKMSRNKIPLTGATSRVIELNKDEFVILDWANDLRIGGLVGDSFVEYPFKFKTLFDTVLAIKVVEEAKLFMILYKTKDGKARLYVGRSSLLVYDRTIRDVEVGEASDNLKIEAHFIQWSQILIMVYHMGDATFNRSFIYFVNGPVFFVEKGSTVSEISFTLNGRELNHPFATNDALEPLRVESKDIHFRDPEGSHITKEIETTGELSIKGGVRDVEALSDNEDVKFIPRINRIDSKNIKSSKRRGLDTHSTKNLASSFNDFSFFYGDLVVKKKEQRANQLYKNCKFIDRGDLGTTANPKLLCRDKARNDNVITDLQSDPVFLNAPDVKLNNFNLIDLAGYRYFFAKTSGAKNLHFWKFKSTTEGYELESRRVVTANDYFLGSMNIESFFTTAKLLEDKIVLLIHESFSTKVTVKILGVKTNVFEKYNFEEIPLLVEGKADPQAIYEVRCNDNSLDKNGKPKVTCLIRSDQYLYDTIVVNEENKGFSFRVESQYPFWRNQLLDHNLGIFESNNFVAVFTKARSGNDVWIYRRPQDEDGKLTTSPLFGSFQVNANERISKISLSDPDEASLKVNPSLKKTDSTLWVAVFTEPLQNSEYYSNLNVDQYVLSEFKIKANARADRVNNDIEVKFTDQSNALHTITLRVIIEHNFVLKLLLWIFLILLVVFIALAVFVVLAYKENKRIKNALLKKGHNQSMFLDRTMMQV